MATSTYSAVNMLFAGTIFGWIQLFAFLLILYFIIRLLIVPLKFFWQSLFRITQK